MKPIKFKGANRVLTAPEGMDNCESLPVVTDGEQCISRWKLSWRERLLALFIGRMWISVYSGKTQPPIALWFGSLSVMSKKEFGEKETEEMLSDNPIEVSN